MWLSFKSYFDINSFHSVLDGNIMMKCKQTNHKPAKERKHAKISLLQQKAEGSQNRPAEEP